ncbi:hypothetical protein D3C87_1067730 [compost metagenome]
MKLIYTQTALSKNNDYVSYDITNESDVQIGTAEGSGNKYGEFVSIIKIFNPEFYNKGLGFQFFKKVFDFINIYHPISLIKGSWHEGEEFKDFKNGMSSNLLIFRENLERMSPIESAILTPTGKWAKKIGFNKCDIINNRETEVIVYFTK